MTVVQLPCGCRYVGGLWMDRCFPHWSRKPSDKGITKDVIDENYNETAPEHASLDCRAPILPVCNPRDRVRVFKVVVQRRP